MVLKFDKYQGAGNDFIIINSYNSDINLSNTQIKMLCDRRFGIGADGLIIIYNSSKADFEMKYFNSDGYEGSMCGNGGRCAAMYAFKNGICPSSTSFIASDGEHKAEIDNNKVKLSMSDVSNIIEYDDGYFLDTGSPHFVKFVSDIENTNIESEGKYIANEHRFSPNRTNVNFVEISNNISKIRTFERGVEAETFACGTGAVAAAISIAVQHNINNNIAIEARGGLLKVNFKRTNSNFSNIYLNGEAKFVFSGEIDISIQ